MQQQNQFQKIHQKTQSWKLKCVLGLTFSLLLLPSLTGTAHAYDRNSAIAYADNWAFGRNINYPNFGGEDCTNFVSQSLAAGGYKFVGAFGGATNDDHNWYMRYSPYRNITRYTLSWSVAPDQYSFQIYHYPGGYQQAVVSLSSNASAYTSQFDAPAMIGGDVLFYDWGDGNGISHSAIQIPTGYSSEGSQSYGDLLDAHANNHYHASWNFRESNGAYWRTTTIFEMHIDNAN